MVEIIDYQEHWPDEFKQIASKLKDGLGDLALRIDHIGSTSVPGLPAKDNIDVQITVPALDESLLNAMNAMGYTQVLENSQDHLPPGVDEVESNWQKWFFSPPSGHRKSNTHVRVPGQPNQRYPLLFRDYLRSHPESAEAYARLKRQLADNLADVSTYPEVKDPAVDLIYLAAEEWAENTNWQPGPSDM